MAQLRSGKDLWCDAFTRYMRSTVVVFAAMNRGKVTAEQPFRIRIFIREATISHFHFPGHNHPFSSYYPHMSRRNKEDTRKKNKRRYRKKERLMTRRCSVRQKQLGGSREKAACLLEKMSFVLGFREWTSQFQVYLHVMGLH